MTSQEPKTPQSADHEIPDTEVLVVSAPSPVFVDSTGRRRRHLQRLAYVFGAVCALYGGLISVSLAGGPVSATAIRSLPDLPDHEVEPGQTRPSPTPEPTVSTPPKTRFISESLPRDLPVPGERRIVAPKPPPPMPPMPPKTPSAKPTKTPAPASSTTRPASTTPSASVSATPSVSTSVVPPKPPTSAAAPSPSNAGTGGSGGDDGTSVQVGGLTTPTRAPSSGSVVAESADTEPSAGPTADTA